MTDQTAEFTQLKTLVHEQKQFFASGTTLPYQFRIKQLKKLRSAIIDRKQQFYKALKQDLNKNAFESYATEIGIVLEEITFHIKHLKKWIRSQRVWTPLVHFPSKSRIIARPFGVSLIFGTWNYPFQLTLNPLVGSISAGNCAIIKPSGQTKTTAKLMEEMITATFPSKYLKVILGSHDASDFLLTQPIDHIFFTGSTSIGKKIMQAAAEQLIPLVLELGGKSPAIIHHDTNIEVTARRLVWGKFINAGQTCIAPDYVYVHKSIKEELIHSMEKWIIKHYYIGTNNSLNNNTLNFEEYPKIINQSHYQRLMGYLKDVSIRFGGEGFQKSLQISPTLIDNVDWTHQIMQEEIFGPILPILTYSDVKEVIQNINMHFSKPLACYIFTNSKNIEEQLINSIRFGGGAINDTLTHIANPRLPFGGVGPSGIGKYHGKYSFDAFSNQKSILKKGWWPDLPFRYPPYKNKYLRLISKLLK